MFVTRLISGVVLVAAALLTVGLGSWVLFFTVLILSLIGAGELYKAMKVREQSFPGPLELAGYAGIVLYYVSPVSYTHLAPQGKKQTPFRILD